MDNLPNNVGGYELINPEKVKRALYGTLGSKGELKGGVAKPDGSYDDAALLAEYDRLGGLIKKGEDKVQLGSFYDFGARAPHAKPKVMLEFRVNGRVMAVPEDEPLPAVVRAAREVAAEEAAADEEKVAKKRRK